LQRAASKEWHQDEAMRGHHRHRPATRKTLPEAVDLHKAKRADIVLDKGVTLDLATIPAEDPKAYAMIRKADTVRVFQIESRARDCRCLGKTCNGSEHELIEWLFVTRKPPAR
jgi:hypothetical protein